MKTILTFLLLLIALLLSSCVQTTLYEGGRKIAQFGSDIDGLTYHRRAADGEVSLSGNLSNSRVISATGRALRHQLPLP